MLTRGRRMNSKHIAYFSLSALALTFGSGCASSGSSRSDELRQRVQERMTIEQGVSGVEEPETAPPEWAQRIGDEVAPGFTIKVNSKDDDEINGSYVVDEKGYLRLPYDVTVAAAGLSEKALESKIRNSYRPYFLRPDMGIDIEKREYYVTVKGLVKKPGAVLVSNDASLDEVVSGAGGLLRDVRSSASAQYARISQGKTSYVVNLNDYFAGNTPDYAVPKWQGGESVSLIREPGRDDSQGSTQRSFVKVLGQVENPGEFPFESGKDFYHYLIKSGGPSEKADLTNIAIIRAGRSSNTSKRFNLEDEENTPQISAGDTILLNASNPSSLEKTSRVWSGFAAVVSAIGALAILAVAL
jgi:polysaccharide biosynthesis/export protein